MRQKVRLAASNGHSQTVLKELALSVQPDSFKGTSPLGTALSVQPDSLLGTGPHGSDHVLYDRGKDPYKTLEISDFKHFISE